MSPACRGASRQSFPQRTRGLWRGLSERVMGRNRADRPRDSPFFRRKSGAATSRTACSPSQACHADITLSGDGLGHILTQRGGGADRPPCPASARTGTTRRSGKLSPSGFLSPQSDPLPGRSALRSGFGHGARERDWPETRGRAGASCPPARFRGAPWAPAVAGTAWPFGLSPSEAEAPEGRRYEQ